jgi:hypothetical protein
MKILIAITSCRRDARNGFNQALRDTWLKDINKYPGVDYKFFMGDGTPTADDEDAIWASSRGMRDASRGINYEEKGIQSAVEAAAQPPASPQSDEVVLPVPDDYVHLPVKVRGIFRWAYGQGYDFVFKCETDTYVNLERLLTSGFEQHDFIGGPNGRNIAGGSGWWVSRRTMSQVVEHRIDGYADDCWFPTLAQARGITLTHDSRYSDEPVTTDNNLISTHVGFTPGYTPERMREFHNGDISWYKRGFEYTLVVTSCNRHSLLLATLDSFIKYVDIKPKATIVIEDGGVNPPDWILSDHQKRNLPSLWFVNSPKLGQTRSIDKGYAEVKTDYIFHCEDDWEFLDSGFILKSYEILGKYPKISQVNLRGPNWGHTLIDDSRYPFKIAEPGWGGGYGGLAWNPGLRRLCDYKSVFGTFAAHDSEADQHVAEEIQRLEKIGLHPTKGSSCDGWKERLYSKMMLDAGFNIASLDKEYVRHIGGKHSVRRGR